MTQVSVTVTRSDDDGASHHYLLSPSSGPIRIGRSPANHVKVDLRGISAYHLELRAGAEAQDGTSSGSELSVRACDLSMNGTNVELTGGDKFGLQKGIETTIPDAAKLVMPAKVKRGADGKSEGQCWLTVRWHRTRPDGDAAQANAVSSGSPQPQIPGLEAHSSEQREHPPQHSVKSDAMHSVKPVNGTAVPSLEVAAEVHAPLPELAPELPRLPSPLQLPVVDAPSSDAAASQASRVSFSLPSGTQLRPKAQPKRPPVAADASSQVVMESSPVRQAQAGKDTGDDSSSGSNQKIAKKTTPQKSRSRDGTSSGSGGRSRSRKHARGRTRKQSRSSSNRRSRSRKRSQKRRRRRRRSKSRAGRRKRKRSKSNKSNSSSPSESREDGDKASGAASTTAPVAAPGQPMTGMQQPWGMHWGAQASPWGWNPYMQGATVNAQPQMNVEVIKQQIYFMYQRFKPEKLPEFEAILRKYRGSEYELLQAMCSKYLGSGASAGGAGSQ